jgi:hypothetical protein
LFRYQTRFSKYLFAQPQFPAILCLMRYEGWTFREAKGRLCEHGEMRQHRVAASYGSHCYVLSVSLTGRGKRSSIG